MLNAYISSASGLPPLPVGQDLAHAQWIDLYRPLDQQVAQVEALGVEVPTLADMEEIEISNRLYKQGDLQYMTAVMPGYTPDGQPISGPVAFILGPDRLVTVRHHQPRPFVTFPERAHLSTSGWHDSDQIFLGLIEEMIARLADLLEGSGATLDKTSRAVLGMFSQSDPAVLRSALENVGREGEGLSRVRLGLLSLERVLSFYLASFDRGAEDSRLRHLCRSHLRDIQSLEVHADFLGTRLSMTLDGTLGMINLQQTDTMRVLSVIAALFLPPTLIASTYGMNFEVMPELKLEWGYLLALGLMAGSAAVTFLLLKWKKWL